MNMTFINGSGKKFDYILVRLTDRVRHDDGVCVWLLTSFLHEPEKE
jgi:hypothetical protein